MCVCVLSLRAGGGGARGGGSAFLFSFTRTPNLPPTPTPPSHSPLSRAACREENPDVGTTDIAKILGLEWKDLNDADKEEYNEHAAKDKVRPHVPLLPCMGSFWWWPDQPPHPPPHPIVCAPFEGAVRAGEGGARPVNTLLKAQ